jgi:hypothetical protein
MANRPFIHYYFESCENVKYYWPNDFDTNNFFTKKMCDKLAKLVKKYQFCNPLWESHLLDRHMFRLLGFLLKVSLSTFSRFCAIGDLCRSTPYWLCLHF